MGRIEMGFRRRGFVVHVRSFRKVKKKFMKFWKHYVVVDWGNNVRTYLKAFGSDTLTGPFWLSRGGTSVPTRAMLSIRDTAISAQKISHLFEDCSYSVPLVLSNTHDSVWITGEHTVNTNQGCGENLERNPPENTNI